jgi:hypothetical protein
VGLPYGQLIDIWSLGCILAEVFTGTTLFNNQTVQSLLAGHTALCGELPLRYRTAGRHSRRYFHHGRLYVKQAEKEDDVAAAACGASDGSAAGPSSSTVASLSAPSSSTAGAAAGAAAAVSGAAVADDGGAAAGAIAVLSSHASGVDIRTCTDTASTTSSKTAAAAAAAAPSGAATGQSMRFCGRFPFLGKTS